MPNKSTNIVKDSVLILITNAMTYLATIANTRIVSSYFSLTEYGYRSQILIVVSVLVSVFSLGLSNAPSYFIPTREGKDPPEKIVRNLYAITFVVVLIMMGLVVLGFDSVVSYFNNTELYHFRILIFLMAAEQIFFSYYSGIQIAKHQAIRATILNLLRCIATVVVTILVCNNKGSLYNLILYTLSVDCAFCFYTMVNSAKPTNRIGKYIDYSLIKEIAIFCIPLGISTITASLCAQIDKLFVGRLFSPDDLAIYTNMCTELPLAAISGAFIAVISPYVVKYINRGRSRDAIELWKEVVEIVAIILLPIIAMLFVFSKQTIFILYSEKYIIGYKLFQIFILVEISRITYFGLILRSYGKSSLILLSSATTLFLNVIFNFISFYVLKAGMIGFAISTIVSTYIIQFLQLVLSSKVAKVRFANIFPWKSLFKIVVYNIAFALTFYYIATVLHILDSIKVMNMIMMLLVWSVLYIFLMKFRFIKLYKKVRDVKIDEVLVN